ncbi:MAG: accessory gene regulator B family protein [archaeon]
MYDKTINFIVNKVVSKTNIDYETKEYFRYGLEIIISTAITLFLTLLISVLFKVKEYSLYLIIFIPIFKIFLAGFHFRKQAECSLFTAGVINLLAYLMKINVIRFNFLIVLLTSLLLLYWNRKNLKKTCVIILGLVFLIIACLYFIKNNDIMITAIMISFCLNVLSLNPKVISFIDKYYKRKGEKICLKK